MVGRALQARIARRDPTVTRGRLLGIQHVQLTIPPGDMHHEAARQCYVHALGLEEIEKPEVLGTRGGFWFSGGTFEVHLGVEEPKDTRRHPCFDTDDLAAMRIRCQAAGLRVIDDVPLPGRDRFFIHDPFGNRIEIQQR